MRNPARADITRMTCLAVLAVIALLPALACAEDWPQWCGRPDRNSISNETGLPDTFDAASSQSDGKPLRQVKWVARMGDYAFGSPVVAGGKVFIGGGINKPVTAMLWCFRESDGKMLWRMRSPFWWNLVNRSWGICGTPTVEGDRVYVLDHHGGVLCLDANGLNGRKASAADLELIRTDRTCTSPHEIAPDGHRVLDLTAGTPGVPEPTDAHIIWRFDLLREVNCWPYNAQSAAILIRGDRLYVATGSTLSGYGEDGSKHWIDQWKVKYGKSSYESPSLIVLDKHTGKLLAVDKEGIFDQTFHGAHASPALGVANGKELLFYGAGNGSCYAFDPEFAPGDGAKPGVLKRVWKFDCLSPASYDGGYSGTRLKQAEVIATPVFYRNRIYVSIGNDLKNSGGQAGKGRLLCLDATGSGDITATGKIWSFDAIRSTGTTVAIAAGLVYTADASGNIYCLDADSGKLYWRHETPLVWSSALVADGKVYVASRYALLVFAAGKEKKLLGQSRVRESMVSSPIAANGVLYISTGKSLYALQEGASMRREETPTPSTQPAGDWLAEGLHPEGRGWSRRLAVAGIAALGIALLAWGGLRLRRARQPRQPAQNREGTQ